MPDDAITGSSITPHISSTPSRQAMRALVLGAYGLIGADAARALLRAGFDVSGVGRDRAIAMRVLPQVDWHICDLTKLDHAQWQALTKDVDVVINAAGALQDGGGTNLSAIHEDMPRALCAALAGSEVRVVQISAAGVSTEASTEFFRSKARGDAALIASGIDHVVLRPTLVLGHAAYGGTALLRAAAALPLVDWQMMADSQVQIVALPDLSAAIVACAQGDIANGTIADLTEDQARPFPELVAQMRQWMGLPVPQIKLPMPQTQLRMLAKGADLMAPLGWQSPAQHRNPDAGRWDIRRLDNMARRRRRTLPFPASDISGSSRNRARTLVCPLLPAVAIDHRRIIPVLAGLWSDRVVAIFGGGCGSDQS